MLNHVGRYSFLGKDPFLILRSHGGKTIVQQAGSILLDVEKRNVKHFEVETPYLAAVVKGTKFTVTSGDEGASVKVTRGSVQKRLAPAPAAGIPVRAAAGTPASAAAVVASVCRIRVLIF